MHLLQITAFQYRWRAFADAAMAMCSPHNGDAFSPHFTSAVLCSALLRRPYFTDPNARHSSEDSPMNYIGRQSNDLATRSYLGKFS